jgi:predicted TIM-barrel fold metal-dependent hydrolase
MAVRRVDSNCQVALPSTLVERLPEEMRGQIDLDGVVGADATPEARLAAMAEDDVAAEVLVPRGGWQPRSDPEVQLRWAQVCNDWFAEAYRGHRDRFAPTITVPVTDPAAAAAELERADELGLRGVALPQVVWDPPYYGEEWDQVWERAAALAQPVVFVSNGAHTAHVTGGKIGGSDHPAAALSATTLEACGMLDPLGTMLRSLNLNPDLVVVLAEASAGWLAWAIPFIDWNYTECRLGLLADSRTALPELPSHYIRRQVKATFDHDPSAVAGRGITGVDVLMWGSGPVMAGVAPTRSSDMLTRQFRNVPADEVDRIVRGNASELFGLGGARVTTNAASGSPAS